MGSLFNIGEDSQSCDTVKRKYWKLFWAFVVAFIGVILFLPVKLITSEQGFLEPWFILYSAVAVFAFSFLAVKIMKTRCMPGPSPTFAANPVVSKIDADMPPDTELPPEDKDLLYSIEQLTEWFEEGRITEAKYHNYRARVAELERWLRAGIKKDIEIRNLRRELKQLKEELESAKATDNESGETA